MTCTTEARRCCRIVKRHQNTPKLREFDSFFFSTRGKAKQLLLSPNSQNEYINMISLLQKYSPWILADTGEGGSTKALHISQSVSCMCHLGAPRSSRCVALEVTVLCNEARATFPFICKWYCFFLESWEWPRDGLYENCYGNTSLKVLLFSLKQLGNQ